MLCGNGATTSNAGHIAGTGKQDVPARTGSRMVATVGATGGARKYAGQGCPTLTFNLAGVSDVST